MKLTWLELSDRWMNQVHTSPKCESAHWPLVSGFAMTTLTPGSNWKIKVIGINNLSFTREGQLLKNVSKNKIVLFQLKCIHIVLTNYIRGFCWRFLIWWASVGGWLAYVCTLVIMYTYKYGYFIWVPNFTLPWFLLRPIVIYSHS